MSARLVEVQIARYIAKAKAYIEEQAKIGVTVSPSQAVNYVKAQGKSWSEVDAELRSAGLLPSTFTGTPTKPTSTPLAKPSAPSRRSGLPFPEPLPPLKTFPTPGWSSSANSKDPRKPA